MKCNIVDKEKEKVWKWCALCSSVWSHLDVTIKETSSGSTNIRYSGFFTTQTLTRHRHAFVVKRKGQMDGSMKKTCFYKIYKQIYGDWNRLMTSE